MQFDAEQDRAWITDIRAGNQDAFEALVRAYYPGLFEYVLALTRQSEGARDVLQDLFLNVWENRARWEPHTSARAYLYGAAHHRALNYTRDAARRRTAPLELVRDAPSHDAAPDTLVARRELLDDFRAALHDLPEKRRAVYRLSRLNGLSYAEIAESLGISINTVRTQMTAALAHMRDRLSRHLE